MIRLNKQDMADLLNSIDEARSYIRRIDSEQDAALYRLMDLENKIRKLLGYDPQPFICWHTCEYHDTIEARK